MIKSLKGNLNDSKNFTKKIKALKPVIVPVYDNRLITTCIACTHTCQDNCGCSDEQKYWCDAMINVGNTATSRCTVFKMKFSWREYNNLPYIYKEEQYEKTITLNELKDMYYDSKSKMDTKTKLLQGAKNDLIVLNKDCLDTQDLITKGINRIQEIALNKSVFATNVEYIELIIQTERSECKPSY